MSTPLQAPRQPVTPDVVDRIVLLDEIDLAPDGATAYVVRRTMDDIEYHAEIWAVPIDGSEPRRVTEGPSDGSPRVSPDGRWLAFLGKGPKPKEDVKRNDEPKKQIWLLDLLTPDGQPAQLTHERHDVSGFAWSPDGGRIAFWGWRGPARFLVGERADGKTPTARRITVGSWRWNEIGHQDYRTHLALIDVSSAGTGSEPVSLTEGDFDVAGPAWDADGRSLVFVSARHELADLYPRPTIWRVAARTADEPLREPVGVARLRGVAESAVPSPDGRWLAIVGQDEEGAFDDAPIQLFVAPADGSGSPVAVAPKLDLPIGVWLDCDLNGWISSSTGTPSWRETDEGPELIALVTRRGRSDPWRFPIDGVTGHGRGAPEPLATGDAACWQLAVAGERGQHVAVVGTLGVRAMEVMEPATDRTYRTITSMGSDWQRELELPRMELRSIDGPGGPIETWVAFPPGTEPEHPLPLVVDMHGGPLGAWSPAPWLEVQILCSAGIAVALPNIRGSVSYGRDWITPHLGHWGDVDDADVMAVVDGLVADGVADRERIGLLGLSYGGFLASWLIGNHPDRFAAAVSDGGVANQVSSWSNSDSGPDYYRRAKMGEPFDQAGVDALWWQSPLRLAPAITAPLLMFQGESDLRCAPQDNEQLFVMLRALGRTVEYVLYPDSAHTYATDGRPDRRKDRHTRMLEWFRRYLL